MENIALTIAGSDPSGGAGLQVDLKVFKEIGVFGMGVLTSLTVQNSKGVYQTYPLEKGAVFNQLQVLFDDFDIKAAKTGMLLKEYVIEEIYEVFKDKYTMLVVDPVLVSSSGKVLLEKQGIKLLKEKLFPITDILTPNIYEAEILSGLKIYTEKDIKKAGEILKSFGVKVVVIKGGHFKSGNKVIDYIFFDKSFIPIEYPRININDVHGTGCVLSSAITAYLALGYDFLKAIETARAFFQHKIQLVKMFGKGSFYFSL